MEIKFGPAGLGGVKEAVENLEEYHKLGLKACEIAFTYGIYIKNKEDALKIKKSAKKYDVELSIHAPYWINLNSDKKEIAEKSKKRILRCLEVGTWLDAEKIVFHPGYYGKSTKEQTYRKIKSEIEKLQKARREKNYTPKLAPETTGKTNVFGSAEEIAELVKDTGCGFCLDFAHILAREKELEWEKIKKLFPQKEWHCHFSGIEYGVKGEKNHKRTEEKYWKWLFKNLPKNKKIIIINESPSPVEDSAKGLEICKDE
ncbi:MAG: TIM barrel protein [archaeon]